MGIDVDKVAATARPLPELVDEAALGTGDDGPGERADQRRHVVGQLHQPLELLAARHVGARQDPGQRKADQDGHHGGHHRDDQGVPEDRDVLVEDREVVPDPVGFGRERHRIADVQRLFDEEHQWQNDEEAHGQQDDDRDDRLPVTARLQHLPGNERQGRLSAVRRRCDPTPWRTPADPSRRRSSRPE